MSHVLMVTWDGGGNVPPLLGIASELIRRGHKVTILGHASQRAAIETTGAEFVPYRHARPWSSTEPHDPIEHFETFLDGGTGRDLEELVGRIPADLVVCDCLMLGALQAAQNIGLPTVVLIHSFWAFFGEGLPQSPITEMGAALGRAPLGLWETATEVLVLADEELDPATRPTPDNVRWTGVVQERVHAAPRHDRSRILLSLSTVWFPGQQEAMQRILDALEGLPVRVTATIPRSVEIESLQVPPHVEVRDFVPHIEVMPTVSFVIGHGGHATTMLALAHGLPLLIIPQFPIDQPMVGQVVAEAGAGLMVEQEATVERFREAIASLLKEDRYAHAASALGERLRALDGAACAADRVDAVADLAITA